MQKRTLWGTLAGVLVVGGIIWYLTRPKERLTYDFPIQGCPEHSLSVLVNVFRIRGDDTVTTVDTVENFPAITAVNSPEYHDCQKFIVDGDFGPQLAIMAVDRVEHERAALILNYDDDYSDLGIRKGWSCLYLDIRNNRFRAKVAFKGLTQRPPNCANDVVFDDVPFPDLTVIATNHLPANIPSAARWDREPGNNGRYYIGIRCGMNHFCEIGPAGFQQSQAREWNTNEWGDPPEMGGDIPPMNSDERMRILKVKGWYDEQILASPPDGGRIRPSGVLAYAFPHPSLHRWKEDSKPDQSTPWVPAAFVFAEGDYDPMGFKRGLNRVSLCKGTQSDCGATNPRVCTDQSDNNEEWWARIEAESGGTSYSCVTKKSHAGPLGAVRWRWSDLDETLWVRCQAGCCQVN